MAAVTAPRPRRYPPSPKFHGAWMGAGTGQLIALLAVQVTQAFTHRPLDPGLTHAIFAATSMAVAALGAYLMPHQDRPAGTRVPLVLSADELDAIKRMLAAVRVVPVSPSPPSNVKVSYLPAGTGTGPVTPQPPAARQ